MKRTELESKGVKIDEVDLYDNGNYAETHTFYLLGTDLYVVLDYNNDLSYHGKNFTEYVCNVKDNCSKSYICFEMRMSEEGYKKLKEMIK